MPFRFYKCTSNRRQSQSSSSGAEAPNGQPFLLSHKSYICHNMVCVFLMPLGGKCTPSETYATEWHGKTNKISLLIDCFVTAQR